MTEVQHPGPGVSWPCGILYKRGGGCQSLYFIPARPYPIFLSHCPVSPFPSLPSLSSFSLLFLSFLLSSVSLNFSQLLPLLQLLLILLQLLDSSCWSSLLLSTFATTVCFVPTRPTEEVFTCQLCVVCVPQEHTNTETLTRLLCQSSLAEPFTSVPHSFWRIHTTLDCKHTLLYCFQTSQPEPTLGLTLCWWRQ